METTVVQKLYSVAEVCKRWGNISLWTVRFYIRNGEIKTVNIGSRVMIPISEVERVEQFGLKRTGKHSRHSSHVAAT